MNDVDYVTRGHNFGELWGLAVHPKNPNCFATCGDDGSVRMWDMRQVGFLPLAPGSFCLLALASEDRSKGAHI